MALEEDVQFEIENAEVSDFVKKLSLNKSEMQFSFLFSEWLRSIWYMKVDENIWLAVIYFVQETTNGKAPCFFKVNKKDIDAIINAPSSGSHYWYNWAFGKLPKFEYTTFTKEAKEFTKKEEGKKQESETSIDDILATLKAEKERTENVETWYESEIWGRHIRDWESAFGFSFEKRLYGLLLRQMNVNFAWQSLARGKYFYRKFGSIFDAYKLTETTVEGLKEISSMFYEMGRDWTKTRTYSTILSKLGGSSQMRNIYKGYYAVKLLRAQLKDLKDNYSRKFIQNNYKELVEVKKIEGGYRVMSKEEIRKRSIGKKKSPLYLKRLKSELAGKTRITNNAHYVWKGQLEYIMKHTDAAKYGKITDKMIAESQIELLNTKKTRKLAKNIIRITLLFVPFI